MAGNSLIGALRVSLGLDSAQFENGLKKAQSSLGGLSGVVGKAAAGIGVAMAAAAAAMAVAVKSAIDHADELGKTAQKIGVSVEALSRLEYAADLSDVSLEQLSGGLKKLSVNMVEAASKGSGPAAAAFKNLRVSVTDASGKLKTADVVFGELAGKFAPMADGAVKTATAVALFGKSGSDLIPLLNSGASGLKEMADEADALGVVIDTKTANSAQNFNDNLTRLKAAGTGVTTQITAGLLPGLEAVSKTFVDGAKNADFMSGVTTTLNVALKGMASVGIVLAAVFDSVFKSVVAVGKAFDQVKRGDFGAAWKTLVTPVGGGPDLKAELAKVWAANGSGMKPKVAPAALGEQPDVIKAAAGKEKKAVEDAGKELRDAYNRVREGLLTDGERRSQDFSEQLLTLQNARKAGLITEQAYLEDFERLQNKFRAAVQAAPMPDLGNLTDPLAGMPEGEFSSGLEALSRDLQDAADQADEVAYGIEGIFYGLKGNNWTQAAAGITRSLSLVQKAFADGATAADKFNAAAGVAQGVGAVVGGKTGNAISGAASGAATGFKLSGGNPIGAALGAFVGWTSSLFGSSKAKKQAKAQAAADAAQEAAAKAQEAAAKALELANQKRTLEIAIMRAQGDEIGAVAAERADELAATDESNRGLVQQLQSLADAADKASKAAAVVAERHTLDIALMEATGDAAGALAAKRADELAALDESNRALQTAIFAAEDYADQMDKVSAAAMAVRDAQVDAMQGQADGLRAVIDKFRSFSDSLRAFRASLDQQGAAASSYSGAASAFRSTASLAKLGNEKALGSLQGVSEQFLAVSKDSAKTQFDFLKDLGLVKAAVGDAASTADRQADIAQGSLDGINTQIGVLRGLDLSVQGITGSVNGLAVSILAQIQDADLRTAALAEAQKVAALTDVSLAAQIADLRDSIEKGLAAVASASNSTAQTLDGWTVNGTPAVEAA